MTSAQPDYRGDFYVAGKVGGRPLFLARTSQDGRGVLTVKAVALSALFVGVVVLTVIKRRRELDAELVLASRRRGLPAPREAGLVDSG